MIEPFLQGLDVKAGLNAEPEFGRGSEIPAQSQGCVRSNGSLLAYQALNARARHMQSRSQRVRGDAKRLQIFLAQDLPGMYGSPRMLLGHRALLNDGR